MFDVTFGCVAARAGGRGLVGLVSVRSYRFWFHQGENDIWLGLVTSCGVPLLIGWGLERG